MTMSAAVEAPANVECVHLCDGKLVRLSGAIGPDDIEALRSVLLAPLTDGCRDVVVDAGHVSDVCDEAVAVLIAAPVWVETEGGRFFLSRTSQALEDTLRALELDALLPRLDSRTLARV